MRIKAPTVLCAGAIALIIALSIPAEAFGQRSRGGGSRGSGWGGSKPSSSGWGSSSRNNSASSNKNKNSNRSAWGNNRSKSNDAKKNEARKKQNAADRRLHEKAKANGTHYKDRKRAVSAFKKNKSQEIRSKHPVKFDQEPTTRPSYIPQTTRHNGEVYNITYNQQHGGFGFTDALGMFILYDIMTNDRFVDQQMRQYGYAYGTPPPAPMSGLTIVLIFFGVLLFGCGLVALIIFLNKS